MDISLLASEAESGSDFLTIDDLLDFSNEEIGGPIDSETATPDSSTPSKTEASMAASSPRDKSSPLQPPSVFDSEKLCVPCEDLEELEWLSNFVEESFSSGSDTTTGFCLSGSAKSITDSEWKLQRENCKELSPKPSPALHRSAQSRDKAVSLTCRSDMSAPARTRTKRGRTAVCFWNTRILSVEASESILESSSTASTITSDSDMINDTFYDHDEDDDDYNENEDGDGCDEDDDIVEDIEEGRMRHHSHHQHRRYVSNGMMRSKKFNKGMSSLGSRKPKKFKMQAMARQPDVVRKCLHCATQKTPQWRAGPMGPKTLCNACGVRYKSGRLCAEYRPAASPTFIETMHSNSHRKVLEMRRQRGDHGANPSSFLGKSLQCSEGLST